MDQEPWQVWYLLYLVNGAWFAVAGAAYVSDKTFLKWLALTFYHGFVFNLALRVVLRRDERTFGSFTDEFPLFEVQSIGSLVVFMLLTLKAAIFDSLYAYLVVLVAPFIAIAVLLLSGVVSLSTALISLAIGGVLGFFYAWSYSNVVESVVRAYTKPAQILK